METLTEQKLREMEAEMSRFEEEISVPKGEEEIVDGAPQRGNAPKTIIGARTYHQVKAQLEHRHTDMSTQFLVSMSPSMGITCSAAPKLLPPPPPPLGLRPPPPPPGGLPPARPPPSFVPPQLRGRSLPNQQRPFTPIAGMPPALHSNMAMSQWPSSEMSMPLPPAPSGYHGDHMLQPPGYLMHDAAANSGNHALISASPVIIEKPRVVYSAPPVRNKLTKKTKKKPAASITQSKLPTATTAEVESNCSQTYGVAPGIEVNIPMEKIEAERVGMDTIAVGSTQEESEVLDGDVSRKEKKAKKRKFVRMAAGEIWEDPTLAEWETDDFRMFCGDLGNEVTDETLVRAFSRYPSFVKARVVRDKKTNKTKGYGFASFRDPNDFVKAMREMNGKYVGNRPIKLRKSCWRDRQAEIVKKKEKEKKRLGFR